MKLWKKKHGVHPKQKVFICLGGYPMMRKRFLERGWCENRDKHSVCFDVKWLCKQKDIDFKMLKDGQRVNHFPHNSTLTSKSGLCKNILDLRWYSKSSPESFFP